MEQLASEYDEVHVVRLHADLRDEDAVARIFSEANAAFGPVQVVVINHASYVDDYAAVVDMTLERWNSTIAADLTSPFLVAREFLRNLRNASEAVKDKAAIVIIGSTAGKYGEHGHADYAASKSGP